MNRVEDAAGAWGLKRAVATGELCLQNLQGTHWEEETERT